MSSADFDTDEIPVAGTKPNHRPKESEAVPVPVELGAATHPGLVRENNEDSFVVACADRALEIVHTNLPPSLVPARTRERLYGLAVADGMGGEAAGEVASQVALGAVIEHVLGTADWIMRDPEAHIDRIEGRISERIAAADDSVVREANRNPRWFGMGTTMTMGIIANEHLFVGHVGDSRAYLARDGALTVLTRDHSFAQALADTGVINQEEVAAHRLRNVLLRHLGGGGVQADVRHSVLLPGDQLLLCTDGLSDLVAEEQISRILHEAPTAQAACDQLLDAALAAGGRDNVTILVARYG